MSNNSEDAVINRTLKGIFAKSFMRDHSIDKEQMRSLLKSYIYSGQKLSLKEYLLKNIGKETSKMQNKKLKKFKTVAANEVNSPEAKNILKEINDLEKEFRKHVREAGKVEDQKNTIMKRAWINKKDSDKLEDIAKTHKEEMQAAIKLRKQIIKLQEKYKDLTGKYTYEVASTKELAFNFSPDVIKRMLQMTHLFSSIDSDNIDEFTIEFKCRPKNMLSTEIPDTLFLGLLKLAKRTNYSFCVVCEPKLIRFCFTQNM